MGCAATACTSVNSESTLSQHVGGSSICASCGMWQALQVSTAQCGGFVGACANRVPIYQLKVDVSSISSCQRRSLRRTQTQRQQRRNSAYA